MLRLKIWFTIFTLYEIAAILLLHCMRTCDAMFGATFCNDHAFKYFVWCVAVPLLVFLIAMWIHEIFIGNRRRRFIHRAGAAARGVFDDVKERVSEHVSRQEIEGLITAAVVMGIKKLADKFPNAGENMRQIMRGAKGRMNHVADNDDDDEDDDDEEDSADMGRGRSARPMASRRTSTSTRRKR